MPRATRETEIYRQDTKANQLTPAQREKLLEVRTHLSEVPTTDFNISSHIFLRLHHDRLSDRAREIGKAFPALESRSPKYGLAWECESSLKHSYMRLSTQ